MGEKIIHLDQIRQAKIRAGLSGSLVTGFGETGIGMNNFGGGEEDLDTMSRYVESQARRVRDESATLLDNAQDLSVEVGLLVSEEHGED